jgi:hypothetical protein
MAGTNVVKFIAVRASNLGIIWINAEGTNPTTGHSTELIAKSNDEFEFINNPPDGTVLQVITPFLVTAIAIDNGQKKIIIKQSGAPDVIIDITTPGLVQLSMINQIAQANAISTTKGCVLVKDAEEGSTTNVCYKSRLASVDIPFGCSTLSNPLRAKRFSFYIRICGPNEDAARQALQQCLCESAIVALLAALATPLGWAVAWPTFKASLASCISQRLSLDFTVALWTEDRCL